MWHEAIVLGGSRRGTQIVEDGFTREEREILEEKKRKMQFEIDGRLYMGWCNECNCPVWSKQHYFYEENRDGVGHLLVSVCHAHH